MLSHSPIIRYRLAYIFAMHWWSFFAQYHKWVRPEVFEAVRKIVACRTPVLGFHLYGCPSCGFMHIKPHSCKSRFCPTCGKQATDQWADHVLNNLLDVHYHHLVFSVPWELRPIILLNRKVTLNLLAQAAVKSIQDWAKSQCGMCMGIILVLHTFGSDLKFHPHLHVIVTGGGLSLDGTRWIALNPKFLMPHSGLKKRWRYNVVTLLREQNKKGLLRFPSTASYLKKTPCFNSFLNKIYQYVWYVFIGASLVDPGPSIHYVGRYTKRAVLAEYRITFYDGKHIRFQYRDYAAGGKTTYKTLSVNAFIGRLIRHIPDKHFPMIRHAGLFANRHKATYLPLCRAALGHKEEPSPEPVPTTWQQRQTEYTGRDPLICPRCQTPLVLYEVAFGTHRPLHLLWEYVHRQPLAPG